MNVEIQPHLFTVTEYRKLSEAGILDPDRRTELLEGVIYDMPAALPPHAFTVGKLGRILSRGIDETYWISIQNPTRLNVRSQPEPDILIAIGPEQRYHRFHPESGDILLVVEVSDTTYLKDRNLKLPIYARAGIPEVWIVNLSAGRIEVFRDPVDGEYRQVFTVERDGTVSPAAFPDLVIRVAEILPS
jgi:Uma2 family endonuclease